MQTILGSGGPIADMLARELHRNHTQNIRLVSRKPTKVNDTDSLFTADLTDPKATRRAVEGSDIAYLTVGLPLDSELWERQFPLIMRNVIDACAESGTKLVFFDNTYMYPGTSARQTERTAFAPGGRKGRVRGEMAAMLTDAMESGRVEAVIGRAPEFYGPNPTKSYTNSFVFDRLRAGKRPLVPVNAKVKRSLIWTPDASRALALLGNTPDTYGQTWHLPIDPDRKTYAQLIKIASEITERKIGYTVLPLIAFGLGRRFVSTLNEMYELLARYRGDNIFDSTKFTTRFPDFEVMTYREGVERILTG